MKRKNRLNINGECHCGKIRFQADVDPENVIVCHCTDCQNISGAPYRANVPVLLDKFEMEGEPQIYVKTGGSGKQLKLAFCGNCGSALYSIAVESPRFLMLRLGAVKERADLPPKRQGFCQSAMPWAMDITSIPVVGDN